MPVTLLCVFLGGGVGSVCRYLLGWLISPGGFTTFPWATFLINLIGSFSLGLLFAMTKDKPTVYALLGVGFCGGFTTFSTFSVEVLQLVERDRFDLAAGYLLASVVAGIAFAWLGYKLG